MKKIYGLAFASSLFLLGSCASDAPLSEGENGGQNPTERKVGYMTIALNTGETRADSEAVDETGDDAKVTESSIGKITFIFHTTGKEYFSRTIEAGKTKDKETNPTVQLINRTEDSGHSGINCYLVTLPEPVDGVACMVNHADAWDSEDYDELYKKTLALNDNTPNVPFCKDMKPAEGIYKDFVMSSASYYDSTDNNEITWFSAVTQDNLFSDAEKAQEASSSKAVYINLERVVAKMKIINNLTLTDGAINPYPGANANTIDATISFVPEYAFINNTRPNGYLIKHLTEYKDLTSSLASWASTNQTYTPTVGYVTGTLKTERLKGIKESTDTYKYAFPTGTGEANAQVTYRFETRAERTKISDGVWETSPKTRPNLVVLGKYTCKKGDEVIADADGTFWVVPVAGQFKVVPTEEKAIELMGGAPDDQLIPATTDGSTIASTSKTLNAWSKWNGWYRLKNNSTNAMRALKYTGGYGYYSAYIERTTNLYAIVRNHVYKLNINGISGLGVGLPGEDIDIVPVTPPSDDATNFYLHMSVDILPWEVVTQNFTW